METRYQIEIGSSDGMGRIDETIMLPPHVIRDEALNEMRTRDLPNEEGSYIIVRGGPEDRILTDGVMVGQLPPDGDLIVGERWREGGQERCIEPATGGGWLATAQPIGAETHGETRLLAQAHLDNRIIVLRHMAGERP